MAWAEQLPSGKYRGLYRTPDGKKKSCGTFTTKKAANTAATLKEVEAAKVADAPETLTWAEWEPLWWETRTVSEGTTSRNLAAIKAHIRPRWGDVPLTGITTDEVQRWVVLMGVEKERGGAGLAPNTVIKNLMILSSSLRAAVRRDLIPSNPCGKVDKPKVPPMPERFLTPAETDALREAIPEGIMRLFYDVSLGTGMRVGEVQALHWQSVDLERGMITVEWSWDREVGHFKPPKNNKRRDIPIGPTLTARLREWREERGTGTPPALEYKGSKAGKPRTGLVFAHTGNRHLDDARFRHVFDAAVQVTKVGTGKDRKHIGHVRIYDLRHTYASWMAGAGVPLQRLQYLLGHRSVTTTERYAKLMRIKGEWDDVRKVAG